MIDYSRVFQTSLNIVKKQKSLVVPALIQFVIPLVLGTALLGATGAYSLISDLVTLDHELSTDKQFYLADPDNINDDKYTSEFFNYIGRDNKQSTYNDDFGERLAESGYDWSRFSSLLTIPNFILTGIVMFLIVVNILYFSCMQNAMITSTIGNTKSFGKVKSKSLFSRTNHYFFRFTGLIIFFYLLIMGTIITLFLIGLPLAFLSPLLLIPFIILAILGLVALGIFFNIRLLFITPALFLEDTTVGDSFRRSWKLSKERRRDTLIAAAIIIGCGYAINSLFANPFYESFFNFVFGGNIFQISLNFLLFVSFICLTAFVYTFQSIFLFTTYIECDDRRNL